MTKKHTGGCTRQNRTKPRGAAGWKRATPQAGRKRGGAGGRSHEPDQSAVTGFLRRKIEKRAWRQCTARELLQIRTEVGRDPEVVPAPATERPLMHVQGVV